MILCVNIQVNGVTLQVHRHSILLPILCYVYHLYIFSLYI